MADSIMNTPGNEVTHFGKVYRYPCGIMDIMASTRPVFRESGWEEAGRKPPEMAKPAAANAQRRPDPDPENLARSMRRARARVRRLALSNDFRWFVTLTLSPEKIDRYDVPEIVRKLQQWCSNQVKRKGLKYVLVPERHKDGAIHFHGFFNDCLEAVPSGHSDKNGHEIFNLPGWTLGFTAAIELYGDYVGAVAYVCKYIGKQGDKPAGRWYYSGGALKEPTAEYCELSPRDLEEMYPDQTYLIGVPGQIIAVCNGLRDDEMNNRSCKE